MTFTTQTITGSLYFPGTTLPINGNLTVSVVTSNGTMSNTLTHAVLGGSQTFAVIGGVVNVTLPTLPQSAITPTGAAYSMTFKSVGGGSSLVTMDFGTFTLPADTTIEALNIVTDGDITPSVIAEVLGYRDDAETAAGDAEASANLAEDYAASIAPGEPEGVATLDAESQVPLDEEPGNVIAASDSRYAQSGGTSTDWSLSPDLVVPWARETLAEIAADTNPLAAAHILADDQGGLYGGDGTTLIKNLKRLARLDEGLVFFAGAHGVPMDGVSDCAPAINALIQDSTWIPQGSVLLIHPNPASANTVTNYMLKSGIELTRQVKLLGSHQRSVRLSADPTFNDHQLIRNWSVNDYTSGETDHTLAPNSVASPSGARYVRIAELLLNVNANANPIDLLALTSGQESLLIDRLNLSNYNLATGTGYSSAGSNRGIVMYSNQSGQWAEGALIRDIVQYQAGWGDGGFVTADSTNGGKNNPTVPTPPTSIDGVELANLVSSIGAVGVYNGSPLKFTNTFNTILHNPRVEGLPPTGSSDTAQLRLHNCCNFVVQSGGFQVGGYDTARPFLRVTSDSNYLSYHAPNPPILRDMSMRRDTTGAHGYTGNVIEDTVAGFTLAGSADPREIIEYSAARCDYLSTASMTLVRGITVPTPSIVQHSLTTTTTVTNTTTETVLDTYSIPANTLTVGKLIEVLFGGSSDCIATSGTITYTLYLGGTVTGGAGGTISGGTQIFQLVVASQGSVKTASPWQFQLQLVARSIGSGTAGDLMATGLYREGMANVEAAIGKNFPSLDTTVAIPVTLTVAFATANAGNTARILNGIVKAP